MLSVPDAVALEDAFAELDLMVSLDFYVTETSRHADYVLPATTYLEREDVPVALMGFFSTPFMQVTEAVVPPRGARAGMAIIEDLSRRIGIAPYSLRPLRRLARLGIRVSPRRLIDAILRLGPPATGSAGAAGCRQARSRVRRIVLSDHIATDVLRDRLRHPDKRVQVGDAVALAEVDRLGPVERRLAGLPAPADRPAGAALHNPGCTTHRS